MRLTNLMTLSRYALDTAQTQLVDNGSAVRRTDQELPDLASFITPNSDDLVIAGLSADSRQIRPGFLFAALPSLSPRNHKDGWHYIDDAMRQGAVALLVPPETPLPPSAAAAVVIEDPHPRRRLSLMAAAFYDRSPKTLAAVTGTNGKTSVASYTRQIWALLGHNAASIGTLGLRVDRTDGQPIGDDLIHQQDTLHSMTTPDAVTMHQTLARLDQHEINHAVMEASSHGLSQFRLDGVKLSVAGFTNLSQDHLDYHGSMEAYFDAKARLFREVMAPNGVAIINADNDFGQNIIRISRSLNHHVISYGEKGADLRLIAQEPHQAGQTLSFDIWRQRFDVDIALVGQFQAENILCALGLVLGGIFAETGQKPDATICAKIIATLPQLRGVRGRMERVAQHPSTANIYVDYAHTPDALDNALRSLRAHTPSRLILVFGCGGDRDRGKRPRMGEIAQELADIVIVTDDNPRSENPRYIRQEILKACPRARDIGDRAKAIETAVTNLRKGDTLLIAGKGHEQGQVVGHTVHPFDDAKTVRTVLARIR